MRNLEAFLEDSFFGILHADADGVVTHANAAWSDISGLQVEQSRGYGWLDAIHSCDRERTLAGWRQAGRRGDRTELSFRVVRPDGARRYVSMKTRLMPSESSSLLVFIGIVLDTTDQVLAERRLRRNNELLRAVLENIPCGVTVFDAEGRLVLDNQSTQVTLHIPHGAHEEVISDFGTLAVDKEAYTDTAHSRTRGSDREPRPRVREEVQPDGRVLEVRDAPMPTGGLVSTYTDITEHKNIIETLQEAKLAAEQAAAAKAAFLAAMSHEIRTPMNGVIGMINVLIGTGLTSDQREIVEVIRQSGESLLVVINDILDYSKIQSGKMELEWLPLRLQDVVESSVRLLRSKAQEKGVSFVVDVARDIPALVHGDRNRLQQVLVNLISNAVKFTEQGEVRISVTNGPRGHDPADKTGDVCTIAVTVADTGVGIPRSKLGSIFEPFVQADSSTARRYGGTGLGLAIARRLVEAMGGSITIDSEPGAGTHVRFSFLAEVAVPRAADISAQLLGRRVLLVRGSGVDAGVLLRQLKRWGMHSRTCLSSSEAVSLLIEDKRFDLVLAAVHQVDIAGREFVARLRTAGIKTPAVLLSPRGYSATADPPLCVWFLPRSASESALYDTLLDAMRHGNPRTVEGAPASQFDASMAGRAPLRILIAEDNEINRKVALRMLSGFGYQADVVRNGAEAIEAVRSRRYDLVLMDIQMPEVDGFEATRFIVDNIVPAQRPRIVAMSASVMPEDVEAALSAGADEYISKPFSVSQLRAALEGAAGGLPTEPVPGGANPPVSLLATERLRSLVQVNAGGAFLEGLVNDFAGAAWELHQRLRAALRKRDLVALRAVLHEYSGMCAAIGAQKLMQLTKELHQAACAGDLDDGDSLVSRCEALHGKTVAALRGFVKTERMRPAAAGSSAS